ncbi:MAG: hypothetical protein GY926_22245 [bacterium]|nr:hypothetical protein [bacterium]
MALTRRGILVRASLSAVAVAVHVDFVVWTRQARARVPWERHPERILYCDRTYRRSETWFAIGIEWHDYGQVAQHRPSHRDLIEGRPTSATSKNDHVRQSG